jgi:hypothetical protein
VNNKLKNYYAATKPEGERWDKVMISGIQRNNEVKG